VCTSESYEATSPRISVAIPLYNHSEHVLQAVASAARSDFPELEILVLDDGSTDAGAELVQAHLRDHPSVALIVLRRRVNRGLGRTRNELIARARGEYVFMLDADNEVYPSALSRLLAALDQVPDALFSYSILEEHQNGEATGLRSLFSWDRARLANGPYIDAMALLRRDPLVEMGGFTEDLRLYGWEDYDLWCRCAVTGWTGVHVPQILGRYRVAPRSMLSITEIDVAEIQSLLRQNYPSLWR
jgi:glycosyltransferase involved in cell wall biosynthesis